MKKYLTLTFLIACLASFESKASTGDQKINNNLTLELKADNSRASCTQTRYSDVYNAQGQYVTTISSTYTANSDDPTMLCALAGAMAQSAANQTAVAIGWQISEVSGE